MPPASGQQKCSVSVLAGILILLSKDLKIEASICLFGNLRIFCEIKMGKMHALIYQDFL